MDWLDFLVALNERLKIEIPEADCRMPGSLDPVAACLPARAR